MRRKSDIRLRSLWYTQEAMVHPAKAHLGMMEAIFEEYTNPGQWVVDPMAGIGGSLIGALMGRNMICVELEEHFVRPMLASWGKMRQHPMLGHALGQVVILRGDARALPLRSADACVFSPPWEDQLPIHDLDFYKRKLIADGRSPNEPRIGNISS